MATLGNKGLQSLISKKDTNKAKQVVTNKHVGVYLLESSKNHVLLARVSTIKSDYGQDLNDGLTATIRFIQYTDNERVSVHAGKGNFRLDTEGNTYGRPLNIGSEQAEYGIIQTALATHALWQGKNLETGYNALLVKTVKGKIERAFNGTVTDDNWANFATKTANQDD